MTIAPYAFFFMLINRLLKACCEIPSIRAALDWLPSLRRMASSTSNRVASLMVGK